MGDLGGCSTFARTSARGSIRACSCKALKRRHDQIEEKRRGAARGQRPGRPDLEGGRTGFDVSGTFNPEDNQKFVNISFG